MKKVFRSAALLFLCTTMYAQDISQTMSMNLQNVTLKEFFKNLEAQTSFSVVYRDIILSENPDVVVSAPVKGYPVSGTGKTRPFLQSE